jgi:hypothetical protein
VHFAQVWPCLEPKPLVLVPVALALPLPLATTDQVFLLVNRYTVREIVLGQHGWPSCHMKKMLYCHKEPDQSERFVTA